MNALIAELMERAPVILDGAWGTQMFALGLKPGGCPDKWNLDEPDKVKSVARAYVEAGSDIILTNTFGANRFVLESHGIADLALEINRRGAALSKEAAGDRARVFGSMGPSGKMLMMEEVTAEELEEAYTEQAAALAEGGADAIVVETMADLEEALIAIRAARATGLPVAACMVYDSGADKDRTMMGVTPEQQAQAFVEAGIDIIGSNCGQGIEGFAAIAKRLKAASGLPVWVKANAGLPERLEGELVYPTTPAAFAEGAEAAIAAGASFIGGCCGTSPEFVTTLKARLRPEG
ncbi:MAG: homocysteine S-methyltransferase family protein [Oceanipulchritudo sp.]